MNKEEKELVKVPAPTNSPAFVEAEKMFEKLAATSKEIATKAYQFFVDRGATFGNNLEDWLRAESEILRTAPAKITLNGDMVNVTLAVPGFTPEQIEVSVKDDLLIVSGEAATTEKEEKENVFYNEWTSDRFMRKLLLPCEVNTDDVQATLKDGVLRLAMTKKADIPAAKVAVQAG